MAVQRAARAARTQALAKIAAQFAVSPQLLEIRDGMVVTFADIDADEDVDRAMLLVFLH